MRVRLLRCRSVIVIGLLLVSTWRAAAAAFLVVNTSDSGNGSLRQAILDANASPGADLIAFDIPGNGPFTIPAPTGTFITESVVIDGFTQPGSSPNTLTRGCNAVIQIRLLVVTQGLSVAASNCVIRGLAVIRSVNFNSSDLIHFESGISNTVAGCFIGVDTDGATVLFPGHGYGVWLSSNTSANTIGGTAPEARNVISGHISAVRLGGINNSILGNYIGTDASGTRLVANQDTGIVVSGSTNVIGGSSAGAGNVICGNRFGVAEDTVGQGTIVQGNLIGTDVTGTKVLGNRDYGIFLSLIQYALIGGVEPGAGNIIGGNALGGIVFNSALAFSNTVQGNFIGTDRTGTLNLGNGGAGIWMITWNHQVGGAIPGAGNTIAFNRGDGIRAGGGPNLISENSIFSNGALGIRSYFPSPSFLVLTSAVVRSNGVLVSGEMTASTNSSYRVELFSNPVCDDSDFGEGKTFLGYVNVATGPDGRGSFSLTAPVSLPAERVLTATATDTNSNTSQFCGCFDVQIPKLSIARTNATSVIVSWPHWSPEYYLEVTTSIGPSRNWQQVTNNISDGGLNWTFSTTTGASPAQHFYRLRYP